jgi:endonuclease/exonuclease/phosphatase family metal-dependent hydrolase
MKERTKWLLVLALALALAACGGEAVEDQGPETWSGEHVGEGAKADDPEDPASPDPKHHLSLLSFNAGLAHGAVALAEERRAFIIDALKREKNQADVVCLQEVWTDDDAGAVQDALRGVYPHFFREKTEDAGKKSVPCGLWGTYQLDRCVKNSCAKQGISTEECVQTKCAERYDALSDACKLCLAANTSSPTWCALWPGAPSYAWDGRNGLLLLSKHPIQSPRYTAFDTRLIKRGLITASIKQTTVHCTHMTTDLKVVPYPEGHSAQSWIEEQTRQVQTIQSNTTEKACTVLMGDLNTGPQTGSLSGEVPGTFNLLVMAGFDEPWSDAKCTWCKDNPLTGSDTDRQLDHIMVHGCYDKQVTYQRVLDEKTLIPLPEKTLLSRLSDHYGLKVEMTTIVPPVE